MVKKIFSDWGLLIVILLGVLACRTLLFQPGYFNMHDDLQMMRQLQIEKCFLDGQVPCRWVPDMGYGYGFPLFNFYPPLPYLVGEIFRVLSFSFVDTAKLTFSLSIILSGVFMYVLVKEIFPSNTKFLKKDIHLPAILAAGYYIWAPYHAVDVYVRGAMNEAWALTWFPLIFFAAYKLIISKPADTIKWVILLALSYFALFTSHNLMVLIFTPIFGVWVLLHLWRENGWSKIPKLIISGLWGLGLAAFFSFPAIFENGYTQIESQLIGYYEYSAHFVSLNQLLFSRFWGYGASVWLEEDKMSFQIGYPHWILSIVVGVLVLVKIISLIKKGKLVQIKNDKPILVILFLFAVGWFTSFMTHQRSIDVWLLVDQLKYLQFPWRFLTLVIFSFSFVIGAIPLFVKGKKGLWLTVILLFAVIYSGWGYFLPEGGRLGKLTDNDKFTGAAWDLQQTAGIYDYLPVGAKKAPTAPKKDTFEFVEGSGLITKSESGTYWAKANISVDDEKSIIRINIFDFPGWKVSVDGIDKTHYIKTNEDWGRMYFDLQQGDHQVYVQFYNTPVRTASNLISVLSWAILLILAYKTYKNS